MIDNLIITRLTDKDTKNILGGAVLLEDIKKYHEFCDQLESDHKDLKRLAFYKLPIEKKVLKDIKIGKLLEFSDPEIEFKRILSEIKKVEDEIESCKSGVHYQKMARRFEAMNNLYDSLLERIFLYENNAVNKHLHMIFDE